MKKGFGFGSFSSFFHGEFIRKGGAFGERLDFCFGGFWGIQGKRLVKCTVHVKTN